MDAKLDITDELLVAYVDDELNEAQRSMVRSVLETSPSLRRRAEEMRLSRDLLREAFPLQPNAIIPAGIDTAARRLANACATPSSKLSADRGPMFRFPKGRKYAMAAALVLSVMAAAGYLGWQIGNDDGEEPATALLHIDPGTELHSVLEFRPSAAILAVPGESAAVRAVLTFQARDGRYCREFEILSREHGSAGIACRSNDGEWRGEVMVSASPAPQDSNRYTPASGSDDPALAEVADQLMQGDPLSAQDEARLLASGWRTSRSP